MAIDRIDWYSDDLPENVPHEQAGIHIGMYLTWIIENDLISEMHLEENPEAIEEVKNREITGLEFVVDICNEKFWDEDLNEEGLSFTNAYYESSHKINYLNDFMDTFGNREVYLVENYWDNYDKLKPVLNKRYNDWKTK